MRPETVYGYTRWSPVDRLEGSGTPCRSRFISKTSRWSGLRLRRPIIDSEQIKTCDVEFDPRTFQNNIVRRRH